MKATRILYTLMNREYFFRHMKQNDPNKYIDWKDEGHRINPRQYKIPIAQKKVSNLFLSSGGTPIARTLWSFVRKKKQIHHFVLVLNKNKTLLSKAFYKHRWL